MFFLPVLVIIIATILNGCVLTILWGWFFIPTFGLPPISIAQAMGIGLVINYLTYHLVRTPATEESGSDQLKFMAIQAIYRPVTVLAIGWVIHLFT